MYELSKISLFLDLIYIYCLFYFLPSDRIVVNIPFPIINRRIKGVLAINKREDVTIALLNEKF